jgi:D-cysteine desulfhydrase
MLLPEPAGGHVRAHLLAEHGLGCEQFPERGTDEAAVRRVLALREPGQAAPYVIPAGGTGALGTAGYVNGALELAEQIEAGEAPVPDVIYVAAGTTGTAAGLALGLRAAGLPTRLVAVRASNRGTATEARLRREIEAAASLLGGLDPTFRPSLEAASGPPLLRLEHGAAGPGYAIPTLEGARAAALARDLGGLELDGTYTAKAFAALIGDAPRLAGQTVLFWNTYDPRPVGSGGAQPGDLPPPLRRYFL